MKKKLTFFAASVYILCGQLFAAIQIYDNAAQFTGQIPHLQLLRNAKKSISIEIYEIKSATMQMEILNALSRGVKVQLVVEPDPVGNACDAFSSRDKEDNARCEKGQAFIDNFYKNVEKAQTAFPKSQVGQSGIRYYNKNLCNNPNNEDEKKSHCFMHAKMIILDSQITLLSTGNFNPTSFCEQDIREKNECRRDFSVVLTDATKAKAFENIFAIDYQHGANCDIPPHNPSPKRVMGVSEELCKIQNEEQKDVSNITVQNDIEQIIQKNTLNPKGESTEITVSPYSEKRIVKLLDSAKTRIQIQAQYLKVASWHAALLRALGRGVKVEINLASLCHFFGKGGPSITYKDYHEEGGLFARFINPLRYHATNPAKIKFFTQGVPYPEKGIGGYLHSKVFIIDENIAWVGSTNGSEMSNSFNRELGIIFNSQKNIKELKAILDQDFKQSLTVEEHIPHPFHPKKYHPAGTCKVLAAKEQRAVVVSEEEN